MKDLLKFTFLLLFSTVAFQAKAGGKGTGSGNNNDSTSSLKSNIVIFKMMTAPSPANGSLKKAGKVARTSSSNSHSSSKNLNAAPNEG